MEPKDWYPAGGPVSQRVSPVILRARWWHSGLTLVELLVAVALLAVLLSVAVPGLGALRESQAMQGAALELLSAVHLARAEAVKRNRDVVICPSPAGAGEGCEGVLAAGWLVFVDENRNRDLDSGEAVLRRSPRLDPALSLSNRAGTRHADERVAYRPDGSARRNLTWLLCSRRDPSMPSRALVLNRVGRPRLTRAWGDCSGAASLPKAP